MPASREPDRRGKALLAALALALAGIVVAILIQLLALVLLALLGVRLTPAGAVALITVLTQGVAFGGLALLYLWLVRPGQSFVGVRWPTRSDAGWIVVGYLGALGASGVAMFLLGALPGTPDPAPNQLEQLGAQEPAIYLLMIPLSLLLIGPGEELLFRGIVQGRLRRTWGPAGAVILAAAIFAAVHVVAVTGPPASRLITVIILMAPSLVLGAIYERTRNIVVPALVHGAYNATLLAGAYAVTAS
jgi:uncharacterized protein